MIEQSESIAALAASMAKAQATVYGAIKDSANPAFKQGGSVSKYADLASVWEACREQLTSNGLSVVQFPGEMVDNRMTMTTQLCHSSGEWMRATLSIPLSKVDAQGYGSAVTYARRYALAAVVGVCPEDDDGNAASAKGVTTNDTPVIRIAEDQRTELMGYADATNTDMKAFCGYYRIGSLAELPAARFDHAKAMLLKKMPKDDK